MMEKLIYTLRRQAVREGSCPTCRVDAGKWCQPQDGRGMPYDPRWTVHAKRMAALPAPPKLPEQPA